MQDGGKKNRKRGEKVENEEELKKGNKIKVYSRMTEWKCNRCNGKFLGTGRNGPCVTAVRFLVLMSTKSTSKPNIAALNLKASPSFPELKK